MRSSSWRSRPTSKRRRFVSMLSSAEDMFKAENNNCLVDFYYFFADFWSSSPRPLVQMLIVVAWATAVAVLNDERTLSLGLQLDSLAGKTMTTIIAFLIVFRTNQSYNRWWEGRILWGRMHWSCVELSQLAASWIQDEQLASRIMKFSVTFAYTVKQCLRREHLNSEDLVGLVSPVEVARMNRLAAASRPYYCTDVIRQCIKKGLTIHPQSYGVQAVARGIDMPVSQMSSQFADMARVRNTPQPECFRVMLHMFTLVYLLLLPVISYDYIGYWVIPEVFVTSYLMLGLQLAAKYLEDPFGYDLVDLDLDEYMASLKDQCQTAFYIGEKGGFDLTLENGLAEGHDPASDLVRDGRIDCSQSARSFAFTAGVEQAPAWEAPKSPDTMAPVTTERSPSVTHANSTTGNTPPSPTSQGGHTIISSTSEEIFDPRFAEDFANSRAKSSAMGQNTLDISQDSSDQSTAPPKGKPVPSGPRVSLSFRHRTQEEVAPRRRTKPRPGRGRAPLEDERSLSPHRVIVQECRFEQQGPLKSAEVV